MDKKERAEQLQRLAPQLRPEEAEEINGLFRAYLFRRSGTGEVWTTCCRKRAAIRRDTENADELRILHALHTPEPRSTWDNRPETKRRERCPWCGAEVTVKELAHSGERKNLREYRRAVVLRQWRGALWATAWDCFKDYGEKDRATRRPLLTELPDVKLMGVYRFTPGMAESAQRPYWWSAGEPLTEYTRQTEPMKKGAMWRICGPYGFCADLGGKDYDIIGWSEVKKSFLKYTGVERVQVAGDRQLQLLTAACFYPRQIEWLVKLGLRDAVRDIAESGKKNAAAIHWEAKTPADFTGCTIRELETIRETVREMYRMDAVQLLRTLRRRGAEATAEACGSLAELKGSLSTKELLAMMKKYHLPAKRLSAYLQRVATQSAVKGAAGHYRDYLEAAEGCGLDLTNPIHLMPRGFWEKHDRVTEAWSAIKEKAESGERRKTYRERLRGLVEKYLYWNDAYLIRPPVSAKEIAAEGKALDHCVGGYADRHVNGVTTILFLRRRDRPHVPLVTIEMDGDRVRQIHGYKNERMSCAENPGRIPPRELYGDAILDEWLKWLKNGSKRDKQGRPKRGRKRAKKETAA